MLGLVDAMLEAANWHTISTGTSDLASVLSSCLCAATMSVHPILVTSYRCRNMQIFDNWCFVIVVVLWQDFVALQEPVVDSSCCAPSFQGCARDVLLPS